MQRERILELAKEAGLVRTQACCEGVKNKLCSNDVWKGDLGAFVAMIEVDYGKIIRETYARMTPVDTLAEATVKKK
jgi:hypothetical protein